MGKKVSVEERKKQAHKIHSAQYCYSKWPEVVTLETRVDNTCARHGLFNQKLKDHLVGRCGCPKCGPEKAKQTNLEVRGVEHPAQSSDVKLKMKQTNMERYGEENVMLVQEFKNKIKNTNLRVRGHENPMQCPRVKEKAKQTNLRVRGVEYSLQSPDVREKAKQTNLKVRGVANPFQCPDVKEKIKQSNIKNLGCEYPMQSPTVREKSRSTNMRLRGHEYPMQSSESKRKGQHTNMQARGYKWSFQCPKVQEKTKQTYLNTHGVSCYSHTHISPKSLLLLNDVKWLTMQHHVLENTLFNIAGVLGVSNVTVGNYFKKHGIKIKHFQRSEGEKEVADFITTLFPNHEILLNARNVLTHNGLELDIYIPHLKIAIEYSGEFYHMKPGAPERDARKKQLCENLGIHLITIWHEADWLADQDKIKEMLINTLLKE